MTSWNDGYVTDVAYTRNAFREMTPVWLSLAALFLGHQPPDLTKPFRYADLGCGHGLTATIVAATNPHAEVWGFDFNPAHIESARRLAGAAGLTNLHFQEASFAELAAMPAAGLPDFDFIVSHGVLSWVSAENRAALIRVIGQRLRPGGLCYLSYNVTTGWTSMVPIHALMRLLMGQSQERTDIGAAGVLDYLDVLKDSGASFFARNPAVLSRLADMRKQDPRYIAHEFLNADWHPLMFADMAAAMEAAKCSYIGSATLTENIDPVSIQPAMTVLTAETTDIVLKETLRDFALAQTFRRDIYRRGVLPMNGIAQTRMIDAMPIVWTGRQPEDPMVLTTPLGTVQGLPEVYRPLMEALQAEPSTIGGLRRSAALVHRPVTDILQAVSLLISNFYAAPAMPPVVQASARADTDRLNAAILAMHADGEMVGRLASPVTGAEVPADPMELLLLAELRRDPSGDIDALSGRMLTALARAGRTIQNEGKPVTDVKEIRAIVTTSITAFMQARLPTLMRLGIGTNEPGHGGSA